MVFDMRAGAWPAFFLFFLIGTRATDEFDMRAREARVAPLDRHVARVSVSCKPARARDDNLQIFDEDKWFSCFYVEIVATTKMLEGFRHARAHVARTVLFDRDSCNG